MHGFELLRKVAEGSAAEAFLARAPGTHHSVLVEVSRAEVLDDVELYGRFLDRALGRKNFHHPNLLERHSAGCGADGRVYVATEAIDGSTLAERLLSQRLFAPPEAVRLMILICAALEYLHSRGVVHGNLCPKNVYLCGPAAEPVPKLLEMGLLLFRTNRSLKAPASVRLVGEQYLSPERAAGHRADVRSDVYGVGVLLFELLTGHPPYATRSLHQTAPIPVLPEAAAALAPLVFRCLAKEASRRFGSAREVQLALEAVTFERDPIGAVDVQVDLEPPPVILGRTISLRGSGEKPPRKVMVGSYEILRPLGEGGMGRVFLARHVRLDRLVAIKALKAPYASDPLHLQRFVQEARAVNRVRHPHLVEIVDFLEEGPGRVCCVMEPLFGETLKDRAKREPLKITQAVKIIRQACGALAAVHQVGVIHRDLKPDNLFLLERDGQADFVKVLDFGIAQVLDDEKAVLTTRTGEVVGTPAYMAPEQTGPGPLDGRADIYSLGTVLYVLLQGRFPHDATQPEPMLVQKLLRKARPVGLTSASNELIPRGLRVAVERCLERNPASRFQTMDELAEALLPYEQGALEPATRRASRWRLAVAAGALVGGAAAAAWVSPPLTRLAALVAPAALAPAGPGGAAPVAVAPEEPQIRWVAPALSGSPPVPGLSEKKAAGKKRPARTK